MKRREFLLTMVFLALAAVIGLNFARSSRDPVFRGKRLSVWIREFDIWQGPSSSAAKALESSGSSTERLLTGMLKTRDSGTLLKLRQLLAWQRWIGIQIPTAASLHERALNNCNLLGRRVEGAAPAIAILAMDYPQREVSHPTAIHALNTLAMMGPKGVQGLVRVLAHRDPSLRFRAAQLLGTMADSNTDDVICALQELSRDRHPTVAQAAASSLDLLNRPRAISPLSTPSLRPGEPAEGIAASVWDLSRGARITTTSEMYPGCRAEDLFGARLSVVGTPETGSAIFTDSAPDGLVHFVEWETPSPVTLRSFGLIAGHETALNGYIRAFRQYRLYAADEKDGAFTLFHDESVPVPYGSGYCGSLLVRFRDLPAPVTARRFRVEFIQNESGAFHGARAIELYGFTTPLNSTLLDQALENQEPAVRDGAKGILSASRSQPFAVRPDLDPCFQFAKPAAPF